MHFVTSLSSSLSTRSMEGISITSAPRFLSLLLSFPVLVLGLVTMIFFPKRGAFSTQQSLSLRVQTFPTTMIAGVGTGFFFSSSSMVEMVATLLCCLEVVPFDKTAAGMSGSIPASSKPFIISGRAVSPIMNTMVPLSLVRDSKSISSFSSCFLCPVIMVTDDVKSL